MPSKRALVGVQFAPVGPRGQRSSSALCRAVLAEAVGKASSKAADAVLKQKKWRWQYAKHFVDLAVQTAKRPQLTSTIAEVGLNALHAGLEYHHPQTTQPTAGKVTSLREAVRSIAPPAQGFSTATVHGKGSLPSELTVPKAGQTLKGAALLKQIALWESTGIIEPSAARALELLANDPKCDALNLSGRHFLVLGACSQMGPTRFLLRHGATVHAVDLPRPAIWRKLLAFARTTAGTLCFPVCARSGDKRAVHQRAGCNILTQLPQVAAWCRSRAPAQTLAAGVYLYLDGSLFVKLIAAADALVEDLCERRPSTVVCSMCSPSETFVLTQDVKEFNDARFDKFSAHDVWRSPLRLLSGGRLMQRSAMIQVDPEPNDAPSAKQEKPTSVYVLDNYVLAQGPNYAFAKQIQRWRALLARSRGHVVSATVGPSSLTPSVLHNRMLAAAVYGCSHFGVEPFEPDTANTVMAAVMCYDITTPTTAAHPSTLLASPQLLFAEHACHGGIFRCGYAIGSCTTVAAVVHVGRTAVPLLVGSGAAAVGYMLPSKL